MMRIAVLSFGFLTTFSVRLSLRLWIAPAKWFENTRISHHLAKAEW